MRWPKLKFKSNAAFSLIPQLFLSNFLVLQHVFGLSSLVVAKNSQSKSVTVEIPLSLDAARLNPAASQERSLYAPCCVRFLRTSPVFDAT